MCPAKTPTIDASQLTVKKLGHNVRRGLESLRKGEYFTEFGLSEDEIILEDGAKLPDKSDKRSPFFAFLNAVATTIVKERGIEKRKKKYIKEVVDRLQTYQDKWAALILGKGSDASEAAAAVDDDDGGGGGVAEGSASMKIEAKVKNAAIEETVTTTPKPAKKASKKRKLKEEPIDSDDDEELLDDEPAVKKKSLPTTPVTPKVRDTADQARWLERKADWEATRDVVLDEVLDKVKQKYGQICFSKWGKEILPVLVMSPFDVPPGPVREMWFDMYEKVKKTNRLANMTHLVYWYGAYTDPTNAYSFVVSNKLVSYKEGVKKGYDLFPKAMQKKLDAGKNLPGAQQQLVRGLQEMKEDLDKEPHERKGRLPSFVEIYDDSDSDDDSDSELLDDDSIDHVSPPKVKHQKKKKAKSDGDTEEKTKPKAKTKKSKPVEDEKEPEPQLKKKKKKSKPVEDEKEPGPQLKKKKKSKPVEDEKEPEPQLKKKKKSKPVEDEKEPQLKTKKKMKTKKKGPAAPAIVDVMADIGDNELDEEAEAPQKTDDDERPHVEVAAPPPVPPVEEIDEEPIPTDEDKNDEGYGESESGPDDDDDAEFGAVTSSKKCKPKKKKTDAKEAPKKKDFKAKTKIDSKVISKRKKAPGIKKLKEMEQAKFEELENKFLRLIQNWEQAMDTKDTPKLNMILSELLTKVEEFAAPFIEAYRIPQMVKKTKLVEGHNVETRKQLWSKMKELYEKKKESVPEGFVARKRSDAPKAKKATKPVEPKDEEATPEAPPENTEATGAEEPVKMEDYQESIPAPILNSPIKRNGSLEQIVSLEQHTEPKAAKAVTKPERKRFSLGSLGIGRMKPTSTEPKIVSKSSTERTSLSGQAAQKKVPTWISEATTKGTPSDETRSFALEFLQQAAPFIPSNKHVNYDAIARALEEAIYDWARGLYKDAWVDKYWEKVHDLVASISGKDGAGTLATMISEGRYLSASEVVKLPEEVLLCSFEGRPIIK